MKHNKLWLMAVAVLGFTACEKVADLPLYNNGVAPVLSTSTTAVAPPASDSLKPIITFSWTDPAYATDTAKVKYIIEIDFKFKYQDGGGKCLLVRDKPLNWFKQRNSSIALKAS